MRPGRPIDRRQRKKEKTLLDFGTRGTFHVLETEKLPKLHEKEDDIKAQLHKEKTDASISEKRVFNERGVLTDTAVSSSQS